MAIATSVAPCTPSRPVGTKTTHPSPSPPPRCAVVAAAVVSPSTKCNAAQDLMDRVKSLQKEQQQQHQHDDEGNIEVVYQQEHQNQQRHQQIKSLFFYALCLQESAGGLYNDETARIYHSIAWYHYAELNDYSIALTYFLQCLRISLELYGEEHASTQLIMDDLRDLLEDHMQLNVEYVNRVFQSWALQEEAAELSRRRPSTDNPNVKKRQHYKTSEEISIAMQEEKYLQQALALIPFELDLERTAIYVLLAQHAERNSQPELALSYYCETLLILPQWLTNDHPRVLTVKQYSHQVAASLTPIGSTSNSSTISARCGASGATTTTRTRTWKSTSSPSSSSSSIPRPSKE